jgi:hypothetical protein
VQSKKEVKMKNAIIRIAFLLLVFSSSAHSAVSGSTTYVYGFEDSVRYANMLQRNTGLNYSCGPTALLYVANYHYYRKYNSTPWYARDIISARYRLRTMYRNMNIPYNSTNGTSTYDLKSLAKRWRWRTSAIANGNNSINTNLNNMVRRLRDKQPVILALYSQYSPVPDYDHLVVFYKYDARRQRAYYFDPYYGRTHYIHKSRLGSAVQGNLPYFVAVP